MGVRCEDEGDEDWDEIDALLDEDDTEYGADGLTTED